MPIMLWVYGHYTYFILSVWGSTSDVRIVEIAPRAERVNVKLVHEQVVRYFLVVCIARPRINASWCPRSGGVIPVV